MKTYEIQKLHDPDYSYLILSTSYVSPIDDLDCIEDHFRTNYTGKVIFDLLLTNGNVKNRFIEAFFDGIRFDSSSFKIFDRVGSEIKDVSSKFYMNHKEYLSNSVLPRAHQFLVAKGKVL
ncbi:MULTISPECIES: type II toxin-antitoxin system RnlB family antitoxin [unclassified Brevibacillus]|uniref:type II toxin-antitoxin system RnlB family antitoxin n=1 Tax=unclassified Brevibacillus TaxID=2684853 RepID=UPI00356820B9